MNVCERSWSTQAELARLRQEVVTLTTENEIPGKAAACFAPESL